MGEVLTAAVRDYLPEDENFLYHTWLSSYREPVLARADIPVITYYKRMRTCVDMLIKRGAEIKVACDPDNRALILGWACAEPPVLHYVYVKKAYRGQGIALSLLNACGLSTQVVIPCTHWTPFAEEIAGKKPRLLRRVDLF